MIGVIKMAVLTVKKYKYIKDENGNKIKVEKTKEEWDKETKKGTAIYYFSERYEANGNRKQYKSGLYEKKREAEADRGLFLNDPIKYIQEHSKKAKNRLVTDVTVTDVTNKCLNDYFNDFVEYLNVYKAGGTAYSYKKNYLNHIKDKLGDLDPRDIKEAQIYEFHNQIEQLGLAYETRCHIHTTLSEFLKYLISEGVILFNYAKAVGNFKKTVKEKTEIKDSRTLYQTLDEYNFFIDNVDDEFWKTFFNFLFWHGIRKGEQQALQWKDIDFENETVYIHNSVGRNKNGGPQINATKNYKKRLIYLAEQSIIPLKKLYLFCNKLDGFNENWYVFGGEIFINRNKIDRALEKYYIQLKEKYPQRNIQVLSHHQFGRHSHATYLLNIGFKLPDIYRIIALRLGDTEEVIRNTYAHPDEKINNDKTREILKMKGENVT